MKDLIKAIRDKSKGCNIHTQRGRDIKGAYVDCIIMIQEWEKANSVYPVLADVIAEFEKKGSCCPEKFEMKWETLEDILSNYFS
jgi:hypothetical protein